MVDTLGEAFDEGWRLTVRCARSREGLKAKTPCIGRREMALATMIWTHGRNCPVTWLLGRLRCPKCGSTHVMLMWVTPPLAAAESWARAR